MFFLIFFVPIGLISAYLAFSCVRQKYTGAALLMGGVAAACLIISLLILIAGLFVVKATG
ncbi:hypothetical protein [Geopsychrobacter electrodiphilus]|uniref:hypothetical protein n=1 Tax=Geopsychrobacter electrodiphilus TaxID=225196 RepID=UPI000372247C|nr:hypothetical protein [Geopsychrobacter electrodiphilus]